jgi:hypothetical protein
MQLPQRPEDRNPPSTTVHKTVKGLVVDIVLVFLFRSLLRIARLLKKCAMRSPIAAITSSPITTPAPRVIKPHSYLSGVWHRCCVSQARWASSSVYLGFGNASA